MDPDFSKIQYIVGSALLAMVLQSECLGLIGLRILTEGGCKTSGQHLNSIYLALLIIIKLSLSFLLNTPCATTIRDEA
jgi:hypothetical protein